jgi:hypothetical protein
MHDDASMRVRATSLPRSFCWTRFGTEAGETIEAILARKEMEREANGGVFFWGIGNSIGPAVTELLRRVREPEVLFSPIKGSPRPADTHPARVVRWRSGEGLDGDLFDLPESARVTSRWGSGRRTPIHYALVCSLEVPLEIRDRGKLSFGGLRNLRSGAPLGASQVTAVVRRTERGNSAGDYSVAFRAALVAPYFVRLRDPAPVDVPGPLALPRLSV